jgi:hypothetical protein
VKAKKVAKVYVPHYEGLAVRDIMSFVDGDSLVMEHFPDGKEFEKIPRSFIITVVATLMGDPFTDWVKKIV